MSESPASPDAVYEPIERSSVIWFRCVRAPPLTGGAQGKELSKAPMFSSKQPLCEERPPPAQPGGFGGADKAPLGALGWALSCDPAGLPHLSAVPVPAVSNPQARSKTRAGCQPSTWLRTHLA